MSVKHILLGVLSWEPTSGYGIKSEVEFKGRELGWGRVSFGSIYPQLKKLQEEGLIQAVDSEKEGRKTKIYDLTAKGWNELSDWLEKPPASPEIRDELFMKMSFWDTARSNDRETLIDHLEIRRKEAIEMLGFMDDWMSNDYSAIGEIGGFGMDYEKARLKLDIQWYERLVNELRKPTSVPHQDPRELFKKAAARKEKAFREGE